MAHHFVTKEHTVIVITPRKFGSEGLSFVYSAEQNLSCHEIKDDHDVKTVVTRWLVIIRDTD
jgi:hypothetical protein